MRRFMIALAAVCLVFVSVTFLPSGFSSAQAGEAFPGFAPSPGDPFFPPWKWSELEAGERPADPGSGPRETNDTVYALTTYSGDLIAAGSFTWAGATTANRIARWDGIDWYSLGSGMDGDVYALMVFDGDLIAGGAFGQAGGAPANYIAKWDGASWTQFPEEPDDEVHALAVFEGDLIAAGRFVEAGGDTVKYIARWNGASWVSLGSGLNDWAVSLTVHNDNLIVGGWFTEAGGDVANYIASWDGVSWTPLGEGMNWGVYALQTFAAKTLGAGDLVAGGLFTLADGDWCPGISAWDGASWSPVGIAGMNHGVYGLAMYDGDLIAGGSFTQADTTSANRVAGWNGASWEALGNGMDNDVWVLDLYGSPTEDLIAGGEFVQAGDTLARHVAKWDGTVWAPLGELVAGVPGDGPRVHFPRPAIAAEPNPFWESVRFAVPNTGVPIRLGIFDVTGRRVRTLETLDATGQTSQFLWDGRDEMGRYVTAGVYLARVVDGGPRLVTRVIRVR